MVEKQQGLEIREKKRSEGEDRVRDGGVKINKKTRRLIVPLSIKNLRQNKNLNIKPRTGHI